MAKIAEFAILKEFANPEIKHHLLQKCLAVCSGQQVIWLPENATNADPGFFESFGFQKDPAIQCDDALGLPLTHFIKNKK